MKKVMKMLYRIMPGKAYLIKLVRFVGLGAFLSRRTKRALVFVGNFKVQTSYGFFNISHGYGREIEAEIFWHGIEGFEYSTMYWWCQFARVADSIFDVGANTGIYSLMASSCNSFANIHAFEPLRRICSILSYNFSLNANQQQSKKLLNCYNIALSDYTGDGEMYDLPVEHMYTASLNKDIHQERGQTLPAIIEKVLVKRLDDFLIEYKIKKLDLIKIDVESHEANVLRGMGKTLKEYHPTIFVEIWNDNVGRAVEEVLAQCSYIYFSLANIIPEQKKHICNANPEQGYINYLICTEEKAKSIGIWR